LKSSDILDALLKSLRKNGTEIKYSAGVRNVAYDDEKEFFIIKTGDESYACDSLVIATGGKSYPQTGSTGDGYQIAENLGHLIEKPGEALTPVYAEDYPFKELSGISFQNISMSIWRENKKINEFKGDLLFTHVNLSGPLIINNSRYIEKGDVLRFNFARLKNSEEFTRYFEEMISSNGRQLVKTVIRQLEIPRRFADKVIEMAGIEDKLICSQLDKDKRKKLIELISNNSMKVSHLGGYNIAMVTKGGVKTDEINPKTMESKLVKGLYFAGEVIDIDGDTGGFNIQAAFSTGRLAAESINSK
jgi:predicted Rossmann fold flavoprotein